MCFAPCQLVNGCRIHTFSTIWILKVETVNLNQVSVRICQALRCHNPKRLEYYMGVSNAKHANFIQFVFYRFYNKVKPLALYEERHGRAYITHFEIFCFYSSAFTTCPSNLFSYRVPQQSRQQAMTGSLTTNECLPVKYAINKHGPCVVTLP